MLVYFMDTWSILWSFVIFYGHFVYVVRGNLVYFSRFGILYQEKSGNPGFDIHFNVGSRQNVDKMTENVDFI
jgi:hypothetical protein